SSLNIYDATNPTSAPSAQLILPANRPWGQTPPATDWDELQFDAAVADGYDYGIAMFQHYGWVSFKIENPAAPTALTLKKAVRFVNPDTGSRPKFARLFRGSDSQWYAVGSYLDGSSSAVSIVSMGADASNTQLVKSFTSTQVAYGDALETAQIAGQWWLFVKRSTGTTGLAIFDVSSAAGASEVAFIAGQASDYYVDQDSARLYILAATSPRTIKVVDIANPAAPVIRSTITLLAGTYSWVGGDGHVVVAAKGRPGLDTDPTMQAFSVVDPTDPFEIAAGELNLSYHDDELLGDMAVILASNGNSRIYRTAYSMGTATTISSTCLSTDPHPLFSVANQSSANATAAACGAADADGFPDDGFAIYDTSFGQTSNGTVAITNEVAQTVFGPITWTSGGTWYWWTATNQAPGMYTVTMTLYDEFGGSYPLTKTIRLCGNPTAALSVTVDGQTFTTTGSGLLNEAATVSALGTTGSPAAYVLARQKPDLSIETFNDQSSTTWLSNLDSLTAGDFYFGVAAKYAFVATDHATCSDALFASLNLGANGTYDACKIVGPITAGYVVSAFRVEQPNGTAVAWDGHPGVVQITNDVTLRFTGKMATGYTPNFVWTIPNPPGGNVTPGSCSFPAAPYTNATCTIPGGTLATQATGQIWGLSVQACQGGIAGQACAQPVQTVAAPPVTVQPLQQAWAFSVSPTSVNIGDEVTITLTQMVPTDGFSAFSFNVGGTTCDGTTPTITCGGFFGTCTPGSTNVKFRYASGGSTRTITGTGTLVSGGQVAASTTPQVTVSSSGSCPVTCPTLSASISGPSTGIVGQNLTFTAVASGATVAGYAWSKDGLAAGTGSSLTTSFSTAATHRIDLTVSFSVPGGCTSSASTFRNVTITGGGGSTLTITPSKTTALVGENIVFSFSPTLTQAGDSLNVAFGDGGTESLSYPCPFGICTVSHAYSSGGEFTVVASGIVGGLECLGSTQLTIRSVSAGERAALIALYTSTNGGAWTNRTNWRNAEDTDFNAVGTECTWFGVTCNTEGTQVTQLNNNANALAGPIPPAMSSLVHLTHLELHSNQLAGEIPPELGSLSGLAYLDLHSNQLTGVIPTAVGDLVALWYLDLSATQLGGTIPPALGNLTGLFRLYLDSNQLEGTIPLELCSLTNLGVLALSSNQLSGAIPPQLGGLANLFYLDLSSNQFTGTIPTELRLLPSLAYLDLHSNQLSGPIPSQFGTLANLGHLDLHSNHLTGTIPSTLGNLASLGHLDLHSNQLTGSIPTGLGNLASLQALKLQGNLLAGALPAALGNLNNLVSWAGLDLRWNAVHSTDAALIAFLNSKQDGGDWQSTQTIAPADPSVTGTTSTSITLGWTPIPYTADSGGYEVFVSDVPAGPFALFGSTGDKSTPSLSVTGLAAGTAYYFVVVTRTDPHVNNSNTVRSELTATIPGTTTGSVATLSVNRNGTGDGTVTSNPAGIDCGDTCSFQFPPLSAVTLTAVTLPGSAFVGWSGDCTGVLPTCQVTMGGDRSVLATFDLRPKGVDTPAIYRSTDRSWYLRNSNSSGAANLVFPYGDPSDQAVKGDWDGDGDDTVGIYRNGVFYLRNSNTAGNADIVIGFGVAGDIPIAGDWDGDGLDTIGVYRPGAAAWFLRNSNTPGPPDLSFTYGLSNETPVSGDWDGDGIDTIGIFRASDRKWYLHNTNAGGNAEIFFPYGDPALDVPVVGDWDGDGDDTVGIYRASLGEWFLRNSNTAGNSDLNFTYGLINEKPLAGDWDGN
ncbi:MAG: fibronectin type III domain-containing protein, partial [Acidobacteria bacterium]|nr:fibronectin type III domain-containing protein [Acidobacteriota bacterium]